MVVIEVQGHFFLVPPFADEEQPMGSSVIMEEDQVFPGLSDGLLQARETVHLPNGLLCLRRMPVFHGLASHSGGPVFQLLHPAGVWVLFGSPLHIVKQPFLEFLED
jgi:hypothetical protein